MKKTVYRVLCIILVIALCGSMPAFAAEGEIAEGKMRCVGDVNDDGNPNAVDARWILQVASGARTIAKTEMQFADMNADGKLNAVDARWILQTASGARAQKWYVYSSDGGYAPLPTYTCAEALSLVNAETAKIVQTGGYAVSADCAYTKNVKLSSSLSTWLLNQLIESIVQSIDPNMSMDLDTIFGMLVGVGETAYTVEAPTDDYSRSPAQYDMIAMSLQESDIVSYRQEGTKLYFTLQNTQNPTKNGTSTLGRMTESFHEEAEYMTLFSQVGEMVTAKKFDQEITGTTLCVTVNNGKITAMEMQYDDAYSFDLELDASSLSDSTLASLTKVPVKGTATTRTAVQYSNIAY
ncbi:MAG: dockerin type I repeat-containing protein [Candidatus Fimenecus sp.]